MSCGRAYSPCGAAVRRIQNSSNSKNSASKPLFRFFFTTNKSSPDLSAVDSVRNTQQKQFWSAVERNSSFGLSSPNCSSSGRIALTQCIHMCTHTCKQTKTDTPKRNRKSLLLFSVKNMLYYEHARTLAIYVCIYVYTYICICMYMNTYV